MVAEPSAELLVIEVRILIHTETKPVPVRLCIVLTYTRDVCIKSCLASRLRGTAYFGWGEYYTDGIGNGTSGYLGGSTLSSDDP